jgi:hypothetical protein
MKQIKFRSRRERVLCTMYIVMVLYAYFRSNTELVPVFLSTGTLVPFGIPAESGRNVPPSLMNNCTLNYSNIQLLAPQEVLRILLKASWLLTVTVK